MGRKPLLEDRNPPTPTGQLGFPKAPWSRIPGRVGMRLVVPVSPKVSGPVIHWALLLGQQSSFLAAPPPELSSWNLWVGPGQLEEEGWRK